MKEKPFCLICSYNTNEDNLILIRKEPLPITWICFDCLNEAINLLKDKVKIMGEK